LLNGAHSSLAYLGTLVGHRTVAEAIADPDLLRFVQKLMTEDILPSLTAPRDLDLLRYVDTVLRRFRNRAIRHPLAQIAWDGSQKLPFRLFGTIRDALAGGRAIDRLCVPIAAWLHFVRQRALRGERVVDPFAEKLFEIGRETEGRASTDLRRFFEIDQVFAPEWVAEPRFVAALSKAYDELSRMNFSTASLT
jgi:fructuronate reductase